MGMRLARCLTSMLTLDFALKNPIQSSTFNAFDDPLFESFVFWILESFLVLENKTNAHKKTQNLLHISTQSFSHATPGHRKSPTPVKASYWQICPALLISIWFWITII